jgi:hypothetical protein
MGTCAKYRIRNQEFVTRQIAGETIVVPLTSGVGDLNSIYTLNRSGSLIWRMLGDGRTVSEIAECICKEYEVSMEEATRDAREFLEFLQTTNLICPSPEDRG